MAQGGGAKLRVEVRLPVDHPEPRRVEAEIARDDLEPGQGLGQQGGTGRIRRRVRLAGALGGSHLERRKRHRLGRQGEVEDRSGSSPDREPVGDPRAMADPGDPQAVSARGEGQQHPARHRGGDAGPLGPGGVEHGHDGGRDGLAEVVPEVDLRHLGRQCAWHRGARGEVF